MLKGTKLSEVPRADRFKFEIVRTRPHGHVLAVLETIRQLGVDELVERRSCRERDLVIAMVAARVLFPSSKLATSRGLDPRTITSTLGESLDLVGADVDELYVAMDWLLERKEGIERQLVARHLESGGFALYDSTSTYFEGRCCVLAKLGHSRDEKSKNPQIFIGLLCDMVGRPLAVEVFAGNTSDPKTITSQITKLREKYQLEHVIVV
ncbi:MAG: hypothetical protein HYV07_00985, partial [Deltaproteobacteria bacterium]|nr:hypothetical protein [Deltaproteobacteria bacterium]